MAEGDCEAACAAPRKLPAPSSGSICFHSAWLRLRAQVSVHVALHGDGQTPMHRHHRDRQHEMPAVLEELGDMWE